KANHPLADAILKHYDTVTTIDIDVENVIGTGLVGTYNEEVYKIGKPSSYEIIPVDVQEQTTSFEHEGKTVVYFGTDDEVLGLIAIQHVPKETSQEAIQYFKENNIHTVMITGDAKRTGEAI